MLPSADRVQCYDADLRVMSSVDQDSGVPIGMPIGTSRSTYRKSFENARNFEARASFNVRIVAPKRLPSEPSCQAIQSPCSGSAGNVLARRLIDFPRISHALLLSNETVTTCSPQSTPQWTSGFSNIAKNIWPAYTLSRTHLYTFRLPRLKCLQHSELLGHRS